MASHFMICAFGPDRTGIVEEISDCILKSHFNIHESRMTILGDHFSMLILVSGEAARTADLNSAAQGIKNLTLLIKDVQPRQLPQDRFEYAIRIMGNDTPGLVHAVTHYLKSQNANVASMETWMTHAPHSGTEIFNMHIVSEVPSSGSFKSFKEGLTRLCDSMNLEADIEPFVRA